MTKRGRPKKGKKQEVKPKVKEDPKKEEVKAETLPLP